MKFGGGDGENAVTLAKDKVDAVYKLPSKLFGLGDYLIVRDDDTSLKQYMIDTANTGSTVEAIYSGLIPERHATS